MTINRFVAGPVHTLCVHGEFVEPDKCPWCEELRLTYKGPVAVVTAIDVESGTITLDTEGSPGAG